MHFNLHPSAPHEFERTIELKCERSTTTERSNKEIQKTREKFRAHILSVDIFYT